MKILFAAFLVIGELCLGAQAAGPKKPSEKELQQFVAASVEVHSIDQASLSEQQKARSAVEAAKLEDEAGARMEKAVADKGLTTERYTEIYAIMQSDPKVRTRVAILARQQTR